MGRRNRELGCLAQAAAQPLLPQCACSLLWCTRQVKHTTGLVCAFAQEHSTAGSPTWFSSRRITQSRSRHCGQRIQVQRMRLAGGRVQAGSEQLLFSSGLLWPLGTEFSAEVQPDLLEVLAGRVRVEGAASGRDRALAFRRPHESTSARWALSSALWALARHCNSALFSSDHCRRSHCPLVASHSVFQVGIETRVHQLRFSTFVNWGLQT